MYVTMLELIDFHSTQDPFCVFVVYDDEDDWTRKELLCLLEEKGIRCCCLEKDSNPGQPFFETFESLLGRSKKVLFVISAELCRNKQRQSMAAMILETHAIEKIITLITDGELSHKSGLFSLRCTKRIQKDSDEWKDMLIKEIRAETPEFCQLLSTGPVSNLLFHRGLCLQNFQSEIFGLSLVVGDKYFRVDMGEFLKHLNIHQKHQIIEACGQCRTLCNVDSFVSIVINTDVPLKEAADELVEAFGRLCQYVCDVSSLSSSFAPTCTVSGPFQPHQQSFVSDLFEEVFDALAFEYTRRLVKPWVPTYVDLEKRIESFQGVWQEETCPPAEMMAKAGFYFLDRPDLAQCFCCGFSNSPWAKDDDPLVVHAQYLPDCTFLRQNLPTEDIPHKRVRRYFKPVKKFESYLHRKESFYNFDVTKYCHGTENLENKEDIACRLAECGFFYQGIDAEIMCFSCGLVVFYTNCKIDPWFLHANLSSYCPYLLITKSHSFMETVIQAKELRGIGPTIVTICLKKLDGRHRIELNNLMKPSQRKEDHRILRQNKQSV